MSDRVLPGSSHRHFSALDGLRAIALLSVLFHHFVPPLFQYGTPLREGAHFVLELGGLGVDLFFALSGFLITGILIDSKGRADFFSRFYRRRSLRIFPAYFAFLLPLLFVPRLFQSLSRWWFILYLRNWRGPDPSSDNILGHLWSLAVEEQFYIVWAVAVFLCSRRWLLSLILLLCVTALPFRLWMLTVGFSQYELIRFTPSRMDALLLGACVAVAWRSDYWVQVKRWAPVAIVCSVAAFSAALALTPAASPWRAATWSCSAVFFSSVVALSLDLSPAALAGRLLASTILARIAKYSYAMYLWHLLVRSGLDHSIALLRGYPGPVPGIMMKLSYLIVLFGAVYGIAAFSWRFIEEPALRWKGNNSMVEIARPAANV